MLLFAELQFHKSLFTVTNPYIKGELQGLATIFNVSIMRQRVKASVTP